MKSSRKKVSIAHLITIFVILLVCLHAYLVSIVAKHVAKASGTVVYKDHLNNYQNRKHYGSALEGEENLSNSALPLDATDKDHRAKDPLPVDHDISFPKATIAYAISLTGCGSTYLVDGAAVLKHSIELTSYPLNKDSKYASKMFAFVHPEAEKCSAPLKTLGYEVLIKETPIDASKIRGDFLREKVVQSGCCQEKEFLKLYTYTLTEYPVAVHLDIDALILQPFDDLYDAMIDATRGKIPIMHNQTAPDDIQAFYTKDYNMATPKHKHPGVQGGMLIVKPNLSYFEEYREVILEGDFRKGQGWKGSYGGYFGAQQIQGLCSYFFEGLHPGTAVELNRCVYNNMNDNPKTVKKSFGKKKNETMVCRDTLKRDGEGPCEDCRDYDFSKVKSAHFTLCQKPWVCPLFVLSRKGLCRDFQRRWFEVRKDWEAKNGFETSTVGVDFHNDVFQGMCKSGGEAGYVKIKIS